MLVKQNNILIFQSDSKINHLLENQGNAEYSFNNHHEILSGNDYFIVKNSPRSSI